MRVTVTSRALSLTPGSALSSSNNQRRAKTPLRQLSFRAPFRHTTQQRHSSRGDETGGHNLGIWIEASFFPPIVKDEPRRDLARAMRSMDRDKSRRWLWRLVGRFRHSACGFNGSTNNCLSTATTIATASRRASLGNRYRSNSVSWPTPPSAPRILFAV